MDLNTSLSNLPTIVNNLKNKDATGSAWSVDLGGNYVLSINSVEILNTAFTLEKDGNIVWTQLYICPFFFSAGWQGSVAQTVRNVIEINEYNITHSHTTS